MKIYTRTGDDGTTGLFGNVRVKKQSIRIEACGAVDELNACLGVALAQFPNSADHAKPWLVLIQNDLLAAGSMLATPAGQAPRVLISAARTAALENQIDNLEKDLKPLKNFILPQGTPASSLLHWSRAVCRRAERRILSVHEKEALDPALLAYFNRLSDFLFVLARWVNLKEGGNETIWMPAGTEGAPAPGDYKPDPLAASLKKLEEEKARRKSLFEQTAAEIEKKKSAAQKNFEQSVEQARKEGKVERPPSPFDLD